MAIQSAIPTSSGNQTNKTSGIQPVNPKIAAPTVNDQNSAANEKRGFFGNILPVGGAILGGIGGEVADVFGGGIVGAGIGGAAGEYAQQALEHVMGQRPAPDFGQIASTGAWSGVAQGVGEAIAPIAKTIIRGVEVLGNIPKGQLLDVLSSPKNYVPGYKGGVEFLQNVVKTIGDNLGKASGALTKEIGDALAPIASKTITGGQEAINGLLDNVGKTMDNLKIIPGQTYQAVRSGVSRALQVGSNLDFEASSIVNQGEKSAIQRVYNVVNKITPQSTIDEVNQMVKTVGGVWNDMRDGTGRKVVGTILNNIHDFIDLVAPELAKVRNDIQPKEVFLEGMRNIIPQKSGKSMTAQDLDKGVNSLMNLISKSGSAEKSVVDKFSQQTGMNIMKDTAGAKIANPALTGIGKTQPGSPQQVVSKIGRTSWSWLEQLPLKFANQADFISRMIKTGIPEETVKSVLQALTVPKKQGK